MWHVPHPSNLNKVNYNYTRCLIFLTLTNLNKINYGYTRCGICLTPTNLNNIKYYYNGCHMCLTPQTRTKLISVIKNMVNCCYEKFKYE